MSSAFLKSEKNKTQFWSEPHYYDHEINVSDWTQNGFCASLPECISYQAQLGHFLKIWFAFDLEIHRYGPEDQIFVCLLIIMDQTKNGFSLPNIAFWPIYKNFWFHRKCFVLFQNYFRYIKGLGINPPWLFQALL